MELKRPGSTPVKIIRCKFIKAVKDFLILALLSVCGFLKLICRNFLKRSSIMKPVEWLAKCVLPLWLERGLDPQAGGFYEALSLDQGQPVIGPRRAMVQARQIYSWRIALDMGLIEKNRAEKDIQSAA